MSYFLLITGLILIFLGGYLLKKENKVRGESFQELLEEQNTDKSEYIKILAGCQGLKSQLGSIEKKLDTISTKLEIDKIENVEIYESLNNESAIDDNKTSLNLRKGEVRFIQDILEK